MVKSRNGISLVELVIGMTLMAMALFAGSAVFKQLSRGMTRANQRTNSTTAQLLVSSTLQKYVATGDTRFFGFSGLNPADRVLARMLIPLAGRCADLSTAGCEDSVALLHSHYDKSLSPSFSALCLLDPSTLLMDTNNSDYGQAALAPEADGFTISSSATAVSTGKVTVRPDTLLGLMSPPKVTLWRSLSVPTKYPVTVNQDGSLSPPLPAACIQNLQALPPAAQVAGLYKVTVAPLFLTPFTGGANVDNQAIGLATGDFPQRVFNAKLRTLGFTPDPSSEPSKVRGKFGINECTTPGGSFVCDNEINRVPDVARVRIEAAFKLVLGSQTQVQRYEFLTQGQIPSASCQAPVCLALPIVNPAGIPVTLALPSAGATVVRESFLSLSPAAFSLIKLEALSRIRILSTLRQDIGGSRSAASDATREEGFDVVFP